MSTIVREAPVSRFTKAMIGEPTVLAVIGINALTLFISAFPEVDHATRLILEWIDYGCMVYFVIEAVWKVCIFGFRRYWGSGWNKFDLLVILLGIPLLLNPPIDGASLSAFTVAPLLRMGRFIRFIRVMRFVPNMNHIAQGVARALKASIGVFLVLLVLNVVMALGATLIFGDLPQAKSYFGNPLISLYTLFKVFTVEGWYEIPDQLASEGLSMMWVVGLRLYFIMAVLVGGILGLSLANAVFVDEMTTDNNDELEQMVTDLRAELEVFRTEMHTLIGSQNK